MLCLHQELTIFFPSFAVGRETCSVFLSQINCRSKTKKCKVSKEDLLPLNLSNSIKAYALNYSPVMTHVKVCFRTKFLSLLRHRELNLIPQLLTKSVLLKSKHKGSLAEDG